MGSHGAKGLKEVFTGSNAQKIARYADVPVLILKSEIKSILKPHVIFVSDFEPEMVESFDKVMDFVRMIKATVDLVYINTPEYFEETWNTKKKMMVFTMKAGRQLSKVEMINSYYFQSGLERYCEQRSNAIIAMVTHGRKGFSRFIAGSLTERVINHVDLPVLSLQI